MFDDLAAYYHENVVSSFDAYRDINKDGVAGRSRDLREALVAATALFHLREHLPAGAPSRGDVERLCPDYALLGDVVNAAKHKSLTAKTPHGAPLVNHATNLAEQLVLIEYEDAAGTYRYVQKTVVAKLADGSERNLLEVLTGVINFWEQHMITLGVLPAARTFTYDGDIRARTRAECEENHLDFQLVRGQRFRQSMRLLRFNKNTGKAGPIDLAGSTLNFKIFRPQFDVEISLRHDASGKELKKTIVLTEDENAELSRLSNDAERQAYVNGLPAGKEALQQLAIEAGLARE